MKDDHRPDAELIVDSSHGDDEAFAVLVRRHVRAATLLATQLLGDMDDAEDVAQAAFIIVHRDAARFERTRPFPPWLFAIVRRLAHNRRARESRRARLLHLWKGTGPSAPPADHALLARLDADAVARATSALPAMQRACLELVAIRGLTVAEVADMHGIAESTVRQHVFRARAALRDVLERDA